jgi:hypothetical protein
MSIDVVSCAPPWGELYLDAWMALDEHGLRRTRMKIKSKIRTEYHK